MLKNKVVVVTGGAGLLGQEFVKAVAENGGFVVIADINADIGNEVKRNLSKTLNTKNISFFELDITSVSSLSRCIDFLDSNYGRIDALVNNAYPRNKSYGKVFFDVQYSDFVENLGLNLGGYFLASQQFSKYFKKQKYGNIVNIASIYGIVAPDFEIYEETSMTMPVEYAIIKSGLIHLTKYTAKYFRGMNIRVNSLSPGGILNDQPESFLKRYREKCLNKGMLDKSDMKSSLVYLLSDMSEFVNGQNIIVDDGFVL